MTSSTFTDLPPREKVAVSARDISSQQNERARGMKDAGDAAVGEPFVGLSEAGELCGGLFPVGPSGASTAPLKAAAEALLASLAEKRGQASFHVETDAWRRWSNVHMFLMRHGVCMEEMTPAQRELALGLMRETLSAAGYETARNIMKLNETIREITGRDIEFSDLLYWFSVMGEPSESEPWGWQIDGHHLIINCFVLGDQVVLTPTFMGSEPVIAPAGKYEGARVFDEEQARGLALVQALDAGQRSKAILGTELPSEVFGVAFRDNLVLERQGLRFDSLTPGQKQLATSLIEAYVRRLRPDQNEVWLRSVQEHLDETYFAWMGPTDDDAIFYYRVHSPVILIEFDHLPGIALDFNQATRHHIHTLVRTPNGNDYGKDLLRQHYQRHHAK